MRWKITRRVCKNFCQKIARREIHFLYPLTDADASRWKMTGSVPTCKVSLKTLHLRTLRVQEFFAGKGSGNGNVCDETKKRHAS